MPVAACDVYVSRAAAAALAGLDEATLERWEAAGELRLAGLTRNPRRSGLGVVYSLAEVLQLKNSSRR